MQLLWYLPSLVIGLMVGFQSGYWQVALMSVLMVSVMAGISYFRNRYPNFDERSEVFVSLGGVAIGNRVLPKRQRFWKKEWHDLLFRKLEAVASDNLLSDLLQSRKAQGFAVASEGGALKSWLGFGENSEITLDIVSDGPHLLIVGPTGSGKSELLHLILTSTLASQELSLALLDFKGGATLEPYRDCALHFATDLEIPAQKQFWEAVQAELETREQRFAEAGISGIDELSNLELSRILVVIDEFAAALGSSARALQVIENISARGRSLGVHLVAATQSLSGIPRSMLTNLRTRIAMASADPVDLVQLGVNPSKASIESINGWAGCFLVRSNQRAIPLLFPLRVRKEPMPEAESSAGEQLPPARSQLLRQMYSDQEPEPDLPAEPSSSRDLQLLSRMARLRS